MSRPTAKYRSKELIIARTKAEKVCFVAYTSFLLLCMLAASCLLVWGILLKLFIDDVVNRDTILGQIQQLMGSGSDFVDMNGKMGVNDATWILFVVMAGISEFVLIAGLFGSKISSHQRSVVDGSPDDEPTASMFYVVTLRIFIATCFVLSVVTFVIDAPLRQNMSSSMALALTQKMAQGEMDTTEMDGEMDTTQWAIDVYQSAFGCCGSTGISDWITSESTGSYQGWSPTSCRKSSDDAIASSQVSFTTAIPADDTTTNAEKSVTAPEDLITNAATYAEGCDAAITRWLNLCALLLAVTGAMFLTLHILWCFWRKKAGVPILCSTRSLFSRKNAVYPISIAINDESRNSSAESLIFLDQPAKVFPRKTENDTLPFQVCSRESFSFTDIRELIPKAVESQESGTMTEPTQFNKIEKVGRNKYDLNTVVDTRRESKVASSYKPIKSKSAGSISRESLPTTTGPTQTLRNMDERRSPGKLESGTHNLWATNVPTQTLRNMDERRSPGKLESGTHNLRATNVLTTTTQELTVPTNADALSVYSLESIEW